MPHMTQPQGLIKTLDVSTPPSSGFFKNEFTQPHGVVIIPSTLHLLGNPSAPLVLNTALLRTYTDSMVIHATGTGTLTVVIAKAPFDTYQIATDKPDTYIAKQYQIDLDGTPIKLELRHIDGEYQLSQTKGVPSR